VRERKAKSQKRAARRAGGKDDALAGGPRFPPDASMFRLPCRPDPGNTALPFHAGSRSISGSLAKFAAMPWALAVHIYDH